MHNNMRRVLFYWGIGSFIYFKVAFDIVFSRYSADMSVMAAMLLSIMVCISIACSTYLSTVKNDNDLPLIHSRGNTHFLRLSPRVWGLLAFANIALGKIIVFGFSKELNSAISGQHLLFDTRWNRAENGCLFVVLVLIPITLYCVSGWVRAHIMNKTAYQSHADNSTGSFFRPGKQSWINLLRFIILLLIIGFAAQWRSGH